MPNGNNIKEYEARGTVGRAAVLRFLPSSLARRSLGVGGFFLLLSSFFFPFAAQAICPVCTVAVAGGVGLSRWLGIDDTVAGVWIGGLIMSLTFWTDDWMERKNWKIRGRMAAILAAYVVLVVLPLKLMGVTGHPFNQLYGVDKLLLGIVVGGSVFSVAAVAYDELKQRNGGRAWFPFQKVVMPVGALAILSTIFYFITQR